MVNLVKSFAVLVALLRARTAAGAGLRKGPLPDAEDLPEGQRRLELENEGKGCWAFCGETAGDCAFCGSGQCCRAVDFRDQVEGCELAQNAVGARCGAYRGDSFPALMNVGLPCRFKCNDKSGDCDYCGTGQCCRACDGDLCVVGCELAFEDSWMGTGSQCGEFKDPSAARDYCPPQEATSAVPSATPSVSSSPTLPCVEDPIVCLAIDMSGSVCSPDFNAPQLCTDCPSQCQVGPVTNPDSCCENFANIQQFSTSIVDALDDEFTGAEFSAVQFSTEAATISNFAPNSTITPLLGNLEYTGGFTNHGAALNQCQMTFDPENASRSRITILLTDGVPTRPTNGVVGAEFAETTAATVRDSGTFILPVFIAGSDPDAIAYMNSLSSDGAITGGLTFDNLDLIVGDIVGAFDKCTTPPPQDIGR